MGEIMNTPQAKRKAKAPTWRYRSYHWVGCFYFEAAAVRSDGSELAVNKQRSFVTSLLVSGGKKKLKQKTHNTAEKHVLQCQAQGALVFSSRAQLHLAQWSAKNALFVK